MFDAHKTVSDLAADIGVSESTVYAYLRGQAPKMQTLIKIADDFHCTTDFLLGRESENFAIEFRPVPPFRERLPFLLEHFKTNKYRLAKGVPVTHSVIYNWQNGTFEPTLYYAIRLADFFGCSVDFVIGREK